MNQQQIKFNLKNYIDSLDIKSFECLSSYLKENKIKITYDDNSNLVLLSNSFKENINEVQSECRSMILDKTNLDIICYSFDNILYNNDAKNEFLKINPDNFIIQECFEGTLLSVYYYDNGNLKSILYYR